MNNTCGNCKHGVGHYAAPEGFLKCEKIVHHTMIEAPEDNGIIAFTSDADDYSSGLYVKENFGCNLFDEKIKVA